MPRSPDPTRNRLIAAGERLFAERGVDNVSLREITRASGSRNVVALQHHFVDRDGLLQAIVSKHHRRVDARRNQMLDDYVASNKSDLRALSAALVDPFAACLLDDDGGRYYLQIFADLINRPRLDLWPELPDGEVDSLQRWRSLVDPFLSPAQRKLHRRFVATLYVITDLARWSRDTDEHDVDVIAASMTDVVESILKAHVSSNTRSALRAHQSRGGSDVRSPSPETWRADR